MKKLIICAAALATALFAGSCQKENFEQAAGGKTVTYTVQLPDVATKAADTDRFIGDGKNVDQLIYEVWKTEAVEDAQLNSTDKTYLMFRKEADRNENGVFTFDLDLVNKQNYTILFWAQVKDAGHYNTTDLTTTNLKEVKIKGTTNAFDESRAAFFGVDYIKASEPRKARQTVTLTRPFGQINLATTLKTQEQDGYDLNVTGTTVTVSRVASTFNVAAQKAVDADKEYVFSVAAPDKNADTYEEKPITVKGTDYKWISMNYVFVPANQGLVDVDYTITTNHGAVQNSITNIPAQVNYKTNIVGNLLTSKTEYIVDLNANWDGEYVHEVVTVASASDLQEAIDNAPEATGAAVNIKIDVEPNAQGEKILDLNEAFVGLMSTKAGENDYGIQIPYGKSIVLDLNGCTITQTKAQTAGYAMIKVYGDLTIVDSEGNGVITYSDNGNGGEYISNTISNLGRLTVKSGTIVNNSSDAVAENGYPYAVDTGVWGDAVEVITNIEGGELRSVYSPLRNRADRSDKKVETNITGGKFYGRIDYQHSSNAGAIGVMNISGGEFYAYGVKDKALMIFGCGKDASNLVLNISGGKFNAEIIKNTTAVPVGQGFNDKFITGGEFSFDPSEFVAPGYPVIENNGIYTIGEYTPVAKIGNVEYGSLQAAVEAVLDGETITLIENEVFTKANRTLNTGTWYDGLYYVGDKSFTIDLGGKTITQDGAVNDYLLNFKNAGSKANTITIKNGTIDAGTAAFCAICTSSVQENQLTINTEDVNVINNISNGSTIKLRGGAILNVKAGTKVTGEDSYLGIECVGSTVNIYDGAEIYMNGTTSYNGCLVGVGYGGTVNVYGGYGKGVKGGFIAMTSGGTINVNGGEWIANTDGTVGNNSNYYVLTAQSNKYESGFVGGAYINVTGGKFRGGMDAWVLNNLPEEEAKLNISGGNFNANPTKFVANNYKAVEADGIWTVSVDPVAKVGDVEYATLEAAAAAAKAGETITVLRDATLSAELTLPANVTINGNSKQINGTIYAGGNLTFVGHTKVTAFSASYYNRVITISEGACLEVTGDGRVSLAYGNTFNITGSIENAKTADKANIQPSLIIPGGISITGGSDAAMNVTNAYVKLGNTSSKNDSANGIFNLNFTNSIAEFTNQFTFAEPTNGKNPTFNVNVKNSVLTTAAKLCIAAPNTNFVVENSNITSKTYIRNSGILEIKKNSAVTGSTIQFGENGGNNGTIAVDASTLTIDASSTGHAFDGLGVGSITLTNGATASVTYYKAMTITADETSKFTGTEVK